jgi:exonuclease SbcC
VVRTRGPNNLYIDTDKGQIKGKDQKETQKLIEDLIGMSFETFCQSIYFAQNYDNKFITANQEDRAKILSEIQDLKQFDKARAKAQELIKNLKLEVVRTETELSSAKIFVTEGIRTVESYEKMLAEHEHNRQRDLLKLTNELEAQDQKVHFLIGDIEAAQTECNSIDLKELGEASEEVDAKIQEILKDKSEISFKLKTLDDRIKAVEQKKKDLKRLENDVERHSIEIETLGKYDDSEEQLRLRTKIEESQKELNDIREAMSNPEKQNCPTCGQLWSGDIIKLQAYEDQISKTIIRLQAEILGLDDKAERVKQTVKELEESYAGLLSRLEQESSVEEVPQNEREVLTEEFKSLENAYFQCRTQRETLNAIGNKKIQLSIKIESLNKQLTTVLEVVNSLKQRLKTTEESQPTEILNRLEEAKTRLAEHEVNKAQKESEHLELNTFMARLETLKEGYREVKTYVFESLLVELTRRANQYLSELFEMPATLTLKNTDMKIDLTITLDGIERGIGNLSGGQFRRTCLAIDLALSDVTTSRKGNLLNLLILDEYFAGLSEVSMEKVLSILQARKVPTLLIEHNSVFKSIVNNVFEVELVDGVSRHKV